MKTRHSCILLVGALLFVCALLVQDISAAEADESKRLQDMAVVAQKAPAAEQASHWKDFLSQSSSFASKNPTMDIWLLRAAAAIATNDETAGKEAAAKLVGLGALGSKDELLRNLMANLVLRGWVSVSTSAQGSAPASGTANSASAATEHPTVKTEANVIDFVEAWRSRWESKDVDSYAELYANDFVTLGGSPATGLSLQKKPEIISLRKKYANSGDSISVAVSNIKVEQAGACWKVTFTQNYKRSGSSHHNDKGTKTLRLKPGGPLGFLIFAEEYNEETKLKPHNSESQQNTAPFKNQSPSRITPKPFTSASDVLF